MPRARRARARGTTPPARCPPHRGTAPRGLRPGRRPARGRSAARVAVPSRRGCPQTGGPPGPACVRRPGAGAAARGRGLKGAPSPPLARARLADTRPPRVTRGACAQRVSRAPTRTPPAAGRRHVSRPCPAKKKLHSSINLLRRAALLEILAAALHHGDETV